jgi:anthranilate/para-aminobenzoate synthase component I
LNTSPIKGTRPRGATAEQEKELRFEMLNDEKERAEHRMLVDLMRNDLGSVCAVGSIKVERFDVEAYATVQHLVSQVTGNLSEGVTSLDALQAVFPGGSITGCPRTVVCATIDELEARPRSFWTGSIGWFDAHSGASAWNILIRTLIAHKTKKQWHGAIAAGGGITIGSSPTNEVEEAKWKYYYDRYKPSLLTCG